MSKKIEIFTDMLVKNISNAVITLRLNSTGESLTFPVGDSLRLKADTLDDIGVRNLTTLGRFLELSAFEDATTIKEQKDRKDVNDVAEKQEEEFRFFEKLDKATSLAELKEEFPDYISNKNIKNVENLKKHIKENFEK